MKTPRATPMATTIKIPTKKQRKSENCYDAIGHQSLMGFHVCLVARQRRKQCYEVTSSIILVVLAKAELRTLERACLQPGQNIEQ